MQQCSICEKPIYNQPVPRIGKIVCGSCPLQKAQGGATGKSYSEVRMDMAKLVTRPIPPTKEIQMTDLKVRSNVKNRTILLDGRFPIVFGADGHGTCPPHLRELLDREMMMKPGRFSIVAPELEAVVEPMPEVVAPLVEEVVVVPVVEEIPAAIDQSFLVAEEVEAPKKPVKASKHHHKK